MDAQQIPDVPVDVAVVGGGDHFGNAGQETFIVFPNGDLDIFPTDTELFIDAGPSQHHFTVELAETIQQIELGLMFREDLAEGRGMLFDLWLAQGAGVWGRETLASPG